LKNFGMALAVPSKLPPNKFGAQKFRHQPLAKANGMFRQFQNTFRRKPNATKSKGKPNKL